jgi:hypothetical protein
MNWKKITPETEFDKNKIYLVASGNYDFPGQLLYYSDTYYSWYLHREEKNCWGIGIEYIKCRFDYCFEIEWIK